MKASLQHKPDLNNLVCAAQCSGCQKFMLTVNVKNYLKSYLIYRKQKKKAVE